jgi:hypothetical protein
MIRFATSPFGFEVFGSPHNKTFSVCGTNGYHGFFVPSIRTTIEDDKFDTDPKKNLQQLDEAIGSKFEVDGWCLLTARALRLSCLSENSRFLPAVGTRRVWICEGTGTMGRIGRFFGRP